MPSQKDKVLGYPVLQAYLKKRNDRSRWRVKMRPFNTRYFILYPGFIVWSLKKGGDIIGVIPLEALHYVAHLEKHNSGKRFDVMVHRTVLQRHTFCLLAHSREDAVTWVKHLKIAQKHFGIEHVPKFDTTIKYWKSVDKMLTSGVAAAPGWTNPLKEHLDKYQTTSDIPAPAENAASTKSSRYTRSTSVVQKLSTPGSSTTATPSSKNGSSSSHFFISTDEIEAPAPPPEAEEFDPYAQALSEALAREEAELVTASLSLLQFNRLLQLRVASTDDSSGSSFVQHWREPCNLADIVNHEVYVNYFYAYLSEIFAADNLEFVLAVNLFRQVVSKIRRSSVKRDIVGYLFERFVSRFADRPATISLEERLYVSGMLEKGNASPDIFSRSYKEAWTALNGYLDSFFRESQDAADLWEVIASNQAKGLQRKLAAGFKTAAFTVLGLKLDQEDAPVKEMWLELGESVPEDGKAATGCYTIQCKADSKSKEPTTRSFHLDELCHFALESEPAVTIRLLDRKEGHVIGVLVLPFGDLPNLASSQWYSFALSLPQFGAAPRSSALSAQAAGAKDGSTPPDAGPRLKAKSMIQLRTELSKDSPSPKLLARMTPGKQQNGLEITVQNPQRSSTTTNLLVSPSSPSSSPSPEKGHSGLRGLTNFVRHKVSLKKYRFIDDGFDLDLTYVTERLIAMGYPSEKIHGVFRNHIRDVQRFFNTRHPDKFMIYNLCSERDYDASKFGGRKKRFPFEDHNPPPLAMLPEICHEADSDLKSTPDLVLALHCKAGKGRTGTVIACVTQHMGLHSSAEEALRFFGMARTSDLEGVTIPSQQRYVRYYEQYLAKRKELGDSMHLDQILPVGSFHLLAINLCGLLLHSPDGQSAAGAENWSFKLAMRDGPLGAIQVSKCYTKVKKARLKEDTVVISCLEADGKQDKDLELRHDVRIEVFRRDKLGKAKAFQFWFNTRMLPKPDPAGHCRLILPKAELDKACKDTKHKLFKPGMVVELLFRTSQDAIYAPNAESHQDLLDITFENCALCGKQLEEQYPDLYRGLYLHPSPCRAVAIQKICSSTMRPAATPQKVLHSPSPKSMARHTPALSISSRGHPSSPSLSKTYEEPRRSASPVVSTTPLSPLSANASSSSCVFFASPDTPTSRSSPVRRVSTARLSKVGQVLCEQCSVDPFPPAVKYCKDCDQNLCNQCDANLHPNASTHNRDFDPQTSAEDEEKEATETGKAILAAPSIDEEGGDSSSEKKNKEKRQTEAAEPVTNQQDWTPISGIKITEVEEKRVCYGDWTRITHSKTGKQYWWNKKTGKTLWKLPPEILALGPTTPPPEIKAAPAAAPAWMISMQKGVEKIKEKERRVAEGLTVDEDDDDDDPVLSKKEQEEVDRIMKGGAAASASEEAASRGSLADRARNAMRL
eukprot:gb/GEZN01000328.1/.p1 GENE.gb/GEZN01000328.1/~~gb/GEZN01000328.1/.p1  ORF type:complete len:1407 (-),score=296.46 gb/GEZN01000328.1/:501-4721(-)